MKEIILKVEGMLCEGCENRIQNTISEIDGVEKVIANYNEGTVKVELNKDINLKLISETIEDIGFKVKED